MAKSKAATAGIWRHAGKVRDKAGRLVRNKRGSLLHTRRRADGSIGQDVRWTAIIVENMRIDGKPRQQHVASLASITESRMESHPSASLLLGRGA